MKLRLCGKDGAKGNKDTRNLIMCKLMINKHKIICVVFY
jgi:hypothetical protein